MVTDGFRVYSGIGEISREEWSEVIDSARAPAFYDYAFLHAYERAPLRETKAFYYLVSGRPAGAVLPAYVQDADDALGNVPGPALPGWSPGDRMLLTHVGHCYDTGLPSRPHLLTPRLVENACAALAGLASQAGAKWFAFQNVDDSTPMARALAELGLARIGMDTRFRRELAAYASVEEFVADIPSKKARLALRRSWHQADREGMRIAASDPARGAAEAVELCRRTTERHGTPGYYPERLHEFVALASDLIRVTELRHRGRLALAMISLSDPARLHMWAGGTDHEVTAEIHSSFPLMLWPAVEEAISLGRPILEAGRGNAAAKLRFRLEPVPLSAFVGQP